MALREVLDASTAKETLDAAREPGVKAKLTANTEHAVRDLGAFGCPWFWVSDGKGKREPFFGSDRWHYMWDYLDLPHEDLRLLKGKEDAKL